MRRKNMRSMLRFLLCALLCAAMTGTALAFEESDQEPEIAIRITPPQSWTELSAPVEIRIIDNAGAGFQSAQVKAGGGSWRDVTAELEQTESRWYCVVDITENCNVQVRVTGLDGTVYEKSEYIQCFNPDADHRVPTTGGGGEIQPSPSPSPITPPGGQGTVIDNVTTTASEENKREFFTIATPDENVFYLVIDRQRDSENVYFLNAVTESDLSALAVKDTQGPSQSAIPDPEPVCSCEDKCAPGEVNTSCPVCVLSYRDCAGTAPAQVEPEAPKGDSGLGTVLVILAVTLAAGGAGWYLKIYKPKHDLDDAEDFDALTGGNEVPTINEDDLPARGEAMYREPDEPVYPAGYEEEP